MSDKRADDESIQEDPTAEPRVERLLTWFFQQELPPALREGSLPRGVEFAESSRRTKSTNDMRFASQSLGKPFFETCRDRSEAPRRSAAAAGWWLTPVCVLALLGSGLLLWRIPSAETPMVAATATLPAVEVETTSLPLRVERVSFAGSDGLFEQRSELRWTSRGYFEPRNGLWVEWTAPELVIEVEPVADTSSRSLK